MSAVLTRILLIEDNPGDARLIEHMLKTVPGFVYEIFWVEDLPAGVDRLCQGQADVVLLDLGLPGSSGLQTLQRLLSQVQKTPALVVLSGLSDEDVAMQAVQYGAQDYLIKGQVDSALLIRSIRYAIERSQAREALQRAHAELEQRVIERTAELAKTVEALHAPSRAAVDEIAAAGPEHGWALLFPDRHPYAGGPGHYAAYLEDPDGFEVEVVAPA